MGVPNTFANATVNIPLSQLDQNFATNATVGTSAVGLGNTTVSIAGLANIGANGVVTINGAGASGNTGGMLVAGNITATTLGGLTIARNDAQIEVQNKGAGLAGVSIFNTLPSQEGTVVFSTVQSTPLITELASLNARLVNFDNTAASWRGVVGFSPCASNGSTGTLEPPAMYCFANVSNVACVSFLYNGAGDARDNPPPDGWVYNYRSQYVAQQFLAGTTTGNQHRIFFDMANGPALIVKNSDATNGAGLEVDSATASGTGWALIQAANSGGFVFFVLGNGNVQNTNNSYGAISDEKLKQDIMPAGSQWNDIKALAAATKKFHLKSDPEGPLQLGLIAQEVQQISPGLVYASKDLDADGNPTGEESLNVMYSVLYMKAVKALGEALERIEALEAKILENAT